MIRPVGPATALLACFAGALGCGSPPTPSVPPDCRDSSRERREPQPPTTLASPPGDLALLEAPARIVGAPGSEAQVAATHAARVIAVHVRAGDRVEAGAPIVDVVMPDVLEAAARLTSVAAARELRTRRRLELASLEGEGLVDRARVFEQEAEIASLDTSQASALATLRAASIRASQARSLLEQGSLTLRSPLSGVVREVNAVVGEARTPTDPPFAVIVAPVPARIEARFAQPPPRGAAFEFVALDGTRVPLASEPVAEILDPRDGVRLVWFSPSRETPALAGTRGRIEVRVEAPDVVELDARALVVDARGTFVDRLDEAGGATRLAVEVLTASSTRAIVRGPLTVGDRVLLEPARPVVAEEAE